MDGGNVVTSCAVASSDWNPYANAAASGSRSNLIVGIPANCAARMVAFRCASLK